MSEPTIPPTDEDSPVAIRSFGTAAANDSTLALSTPPKVLGQYQHAQAAANEHIPTMASLLQMPVSDDRQIAAASVAIVVPPVAVETEIEPTQPAVKLVVTTAPCLSTSVQRYLQPSFLYAALIPAVIAVNLGYENVSNTMRDWMSTKAGVVALQQQVAELKKTPAAAPVVTLTAPSQFAAPPPLPDRFAEAARAATPRQVKPVSVARAAEQSSEAMAAKDDIPAAGEFTLATDDKKPPPSDFKLIGDR